MQLCNMHDHLLQKCISVRIQEVNRHRWKIANASSLIFLLSQHHSPKAYAVFLKIVFYYIHYKLS